MYKFFKEFLKKKEPENVTLMFDAVPAWLSEYETTLRATLLNETDTPVRNIRNATAQLRHIVNSIADAEHDPAIHPKLKTIAKNSLPLFVKAMKASLAKDLPEDIEEFYTAAVESVKGCLNSTRGQGRYLQVVFPEEMKAVKNGIDAIGREINSITSSLTDYRKQVAQAHEVRTLYDALLDLRTDSEKALEKDQRIRTRITEISNRIEQLEKELKGLSVEAGMDEIKKAKSTLDAREKKKEELARAYTTLSMTASHVFRKAEKIATKQRHPAEISVLRQVIDLLSDHAVPDPDNLSSALALACPITERMIAAGEIVLKNKEERGIFSDTGQFRTEMNTACTAVRKQESECRDIQNALYSHPVLVKMNSLEREKTQLEHMREKEKQEQKDLTDWREKIAGKIPLLEDELRNKIEEILGKGVQLRFGDQMKV
jgi:predicted  nucleic acid-binding Zn-ribbon protein